MNVTLRWRISMASYITLCVSWSDLLWYGFLCLQVMSWISFGSLAKSQTEHLRIHQVIQQSFPNLTTVSIGQEESRRTVVYPAKVVDFKRPLFTPHTPLTPAMESSERQHSSGKKAHPSLQAYVPPGLRNQEHRVHGVKVTLSTAKRKENALTSTKRKSIAFVPESRSEPVEVSISPYQVRFSFYFCRREAKWTSDVRLWHSTTECCKFFKARFQNNVMTEIIKNQSSTTRCRELLVSGVFPFDDQSSVLQLTVCTSRPTMLT